MTEQQQILRQLEQLNGRSIRPAGVAVLTIVGGFGMLVFLGSLFLGALLSLGQTRPHYTTPVPARYQHGIARLFWSPCSQPGGKKDKACR